MTRDWRVEIAVRQRDWVLRQVQARIHDALYFNKPLTDEKLRELDRDIEGVWGR